MKRFLTVVLLTLLLAGSAFSQSKSFKLGKWVEINNAITKELNRSYVDSLPLDRINKAAIDAMLSELDPYTIYVPEEDNEDFEMMIGKNYGGIGAVIFKPEKDGPVIINEPYENSPAARFGLQSGDEILEIDGKTTSGLTSAQSSEKMRGVPGTTVLFKVRKVHTGDIVDIKVTREKIHLPDIEYSGMIDSETGYILQSGFTEGVSAQMRKEIASLKEQGMKKLILDLRGNGGGLLNEAVGIVSLFVPKGTLVVTSKGNDLIQNVEMKTTGEPIDTDLPLVVLIDGYTASASEIVSGALQDYDRATIMGTRSYGKGLVQSVRPLPYGGQLKVTTAKYYIPSGRCVQAIDYSNPDENGNFKPIADSLTHEFRTAGGRVVRDGSGITPDVELTPKAYSRLTYSVVMNLIAEQYALKYVSEHESIPSAGEFRFTDYEDFVEFAKGKKFDYRSDAHALFDKMSEELKKDGLQGEMTAELEAMRKALDISKEDYLRLKKDEILPFIEEEIVIRYYYQKAGVKVRLRYDSQLEQALKSPLIK